MFRKMFLSAGLGVAMLAGLTLTSSTANAHPPEVVYRPAYIPVHERHHHHHAIFGARVYLPPPPIVVARPVCPTPIVVVPAPVCRPAPLVVCPR
ncbi:MAG TPA: hypothetical protein VHR66_29675 [Gemmataceae bacterium]|nr:hypothetical protein [Gemmataceae bacterium]